MPTLLRALDGESIQIFNSGNTNKFSISLDSSKNLNFALDAKATTLAIADGALSVTGTLTASSTISALTFTSTVADGTAPFTITSKTKVPNLHADILDGASVNNNGTDSVSLWTANQIIQYITNNSVKTNINIKREEFTAATNQTVFTITKGSYVPGNNRVFVYISGIKQPNSIFTETNSTTVTLNSGVAAGDYVTIEWIEITYTNDPTMAPTPPLKLTGNYTMTTADTVIFGDATLGSFSITLPAANSTNKILYFKKTDSSANTVTIIGTIDGKQNYILELKNEFVQIVSDGTSWYVLGE